MRSTRRAPSRARVCCSADLIARAPSPVSVCFHVPCGCWNVRSSGLRTLEKHVLPVLKTSFQHIFEFPILTPKTLLRVSHHKKSSAEHCAPRHPPGRGKYRHLLLPDASVVCAVGPNLVPPYGFSDLILYTSRSDASREDTISITLKPLFFYGFTVAPPDTEGLCESTAAGGSNSSASS